MHPSLLTVAAAAAAALLSAAVGGEFVSDGYLVGQACHTDEFTVVARTRAFQAISNATYQDLIVLPQQAAGVRLTCLTIVDRPTYPGATPADQRAGCARATTGALQVCWRLAAVADVAASWSCAAADEFVGSPRHTRGLGADDSTGRRFKVTWRPGANIDAACFPRDLTVQAAAVVAHGEGPSTPVSVLVIIAAVAFALLLGVFLAYQLRRSVRKHRHAEDGDGLPQGAAAMEAKVRRTLDPQAAGVDATAACGRAAVDIYGEADDLPAGRSPFSTSPSPPQGAPPAAYVAPGGGAGAAAYEGMYDEGESFGGSAGDIVTGAGASPAGRPDSPVTGDAREVAGWEGAGWQGAGPAPYVGVRFDASPASRGPQYEY